MNMQGPALWAHDANVGTCAVCGLSIVRGDGALPWVHRNWTAGGDHEPRPRLSAPGGGDDDGER